MPKPSANTTASTVAPVSRRAAFEQATLDFARDWNASESLEEMLEKSNGRWAVGETLEASKKQLSSRAFTMRKRGIKLKLMNKYRTRAVYTREFVSEVNSKINGKP